MKKTIILILTLLMITSCIPETTIDYTTVKTLYKGTKGVEMEFVKNAPPSTVYENNLFSAILSIENTGAYDVGYKDDKETDEHAIFLLNPESGYVELKEIESRNGIKYVEKSNTAELRIRGKSLSSPKGDFVDLYSSLKSRELLSLSSTHASTLFATLCYPYQTKLSASACIDPDIYNLGPDTKACETKDLSFSGGQGAPVTVTKIEIQMIPTDDGKIKPTFLIYVEDKGSGQVIKRDKYKEACASRLNDKKDSEDYSLSKYFNVINISASMSTDGNKLVCKQGSRQDTLLLDGKKGIVTCEAKAISKDALAYLAPITITLDYGYTNTISKSFTIEKPLK